MAAVRAAAQVRVISRVGGCARCTAPERAVAPAGEPLTACYVPGKGSSHGCGPGAGGQAQQFDPNRASRTPSKNGSSVTSSGM